ncbi:MAG: hypothetical protein A2231_09200 [Candidatus Firestonebacteria bacterium RIFOXYA2_FULL_40_8]|nr:MAG: hypothetical protein A2231_09200 [Candidatus Firestonebacteria bacterium RIFOXYA2_FULL_40_8]
MKIISLRTLLCTIMLGLSFLPVLRAEEPDRESLLVDASKYFIGRYYDKAIANYEKAIPMLEKETKFEGEDKIKWLIAVDNLGMAYAITGNTIKAIATFEKGIKKDQKYPMFYYNIACTYGEKKDVDKAIKYLKKAYEYKGNMLKGEKLPDPKTDNSFKVFLFDIKFNKFLKENWKIEEDVTEYKGKKLLVFNGNYVADSKSGYAINSDRNKKYIIITTVKYKFVLALPYAENWELIEKPQYILFASNGVLNVSLEFLDDKWGAAEQYLDFKKDSILKNKLELCITDARKITVEDGVVLRVISDETKFAEKMYKDKEELGAEFKNLKQISYYSTKQLENKRFVLHISIMQKDGKMEIPEDTIIYYSLSGFVVEEK